MRLEELFEAEDESNLISERDMEVVYNALEKKGELDQSDVLPLAKELVDEFDGYSRNTGSARFLIQRMHVLMHGIAPTGVTEATALEWMSPARPLIQFMSKKGHNPQEAINLAKDEARTRVKKLKKEEAKNQVIAYYKQNRASFTPEQDKLIRANKDNLIQISTQGVSVADAYSRLLNQR